MAITVEYNDDNRDDSINEAGLSRAFSSGVFSPTPVYPATTTTYDTALGSTNILLATGGTYVSVQVVAEVATTVGYPVKLVQSSDGINFEDLPEDTASALMLAGGNSVILESNSVILENCYVNIDASGAPTGLVTITLSSKKKDSDEVNATISGDVSVENGEELLESTNEIKAYTKILNEILEEQMKTNKILSKIYKPE